MVNIEEQHLSEVVQKIREGVKLRSTELCDETCIFYYNNCTLFVEDLWTKVETGTGLKDIERCSQCKVAFSEV